MSLPAAIIIGGSTGGGGGGGGADPNAVQKTGDTMTGQLIIQGIEGLSTTGHVRLTGRSNVLQIDTNISYVTIDSADGSIGWSLNYNGMGTPKIYGDSSTGDLRLLGGFANRGIQISDGTHVNAIRPDANGDLVVTQLAGPNAGKSINLTAGKWV